MKQEFTPEPSGKCLNSVQLQLHLSTAQAFSPDDNEKTQRKRVISSRMVDILRSVRINVTTVLSPSESFTNIFIVRMKVFVPDEPSPGSVDEVHAVSSVVLPANFIGVMPQCSDLKHTPPTHTDTHVNTRALPWQ